jgi:hypothetical protein
MSSPLATGHKTRVSLLISQNISPSPKENTSVKGIENSPLVASGHKGTQLSLARRRQRYRRRIARGIIVCPVEISGQVLDLLIRIGWISERDADEACKPGGRERLGRLLAERLARSA